MKIKKYLSENGSYSIEASVSLIAFLIAIMFVYTQIKTMIGESIMQHAVDNMAAEMSTYVYVLDRAGLIIDENKDQFSALDNGIAAAGDAYSSTKSFVTKNIDAFTDVYSALEDGDVNSAAYNVQSNWEGMTGDAGSMVSSIKNMVKMLQQVDWGTTAAGAARAGGAEALKSLANNVLLSNFYNWKLESYLPTDREKFCKNYLIDPDSIDFQSYSKILPDNKSIVVAISYETQPAFRMFPVKRKIVKVAYIAAWVKDNANNIK